jgi:hypothetical protein
MKIQVICNSLWSLHCLPHHASLYGPGNLSLQGKYSNPLGNNIKNGKGEQQKANPKYHSVHI